MKILLPGDTCRVTSDVKTHAAPIALSRPSSLVTHHASRITRHSSPVTRHAERGIALVITLIMLAVTLVMVVAFMALAHRERGSVTTSTDTTVARLASESAVSAAEAQIVANILAGFTNGVSSNAFNLRLLVSTNYINYAGFDPSPVNGSVNPTNVNYGHLLNSANGLLVNNWDQNIANLFYLPRAPVFVVTNQLTGSNDFRFYLDLNENGRYEPSGWVTNVDANGNILLDANNNPVVTWQQGDPDWIGVLEHPDAPHGPNNQFVARYAFLAQPIGNSLDVNYIHNQARNTGLTVNDGYMRNQGVGAWEINLAAFLADLNTNIWSPVSLPANLYYSYNEPYYTYNQPINAGPNSGLAFQDALKLISYRYNNFPLPTAGSYFFKAPVVFPNDRMDAYSDGPLQFTLNTNADFPAADAGGDMTPNTTPWSGADNPNHYFSVNDLFDPTKTGGGGIGSFTNHLGLASSGVDTYDRYTYYRMLDQLGTDSTPEDGKLNLNYSNAVVSYWADGSVAGVGVVTGAETNLVPWTPQNFFIAAADQMLRLYTTSWFQTDPTNFMRTYYDTVPQGYVDATGLGVTNLQYFRQTNQIPSFSITNIPVLINGVFVYSPAVNRLLQLAANLYDATTITNNNLPHVFRPIFEHDNQGNVFIVGYTNLYSGNGPNTVSGPNDLQLATPHPVAELALFNGPYTPIRDANGLVNVYGVPWIIGAKKGLPAFNQLSLVNVAQITRRLGFTRSSTDPDTATYTTNQMYSMSISNSLGLSFWNSYYTNYPRPLTVYAHDWLYESLTNSTLPTVFTRFDINGLYENSWPGSYWSGDVPNQTPQGPSFVTTNWITTYLPDSIAYVADNTPLSFPTVPWTSPGLAQFPEVFLMVTNFFQAYILDGNNVIDYVQLREPLSNGNLNGALRDPDYVQTGNVYYQWSTNHYSHYSPTEIQAGILNQIWLSGHYKETPAGQIPKGGTWSTAPTPMGITTPEAEQAFFNGFWAKNFEYDRQTYFNNQTTIQAPYTPSRTVYSSFLLQANDPLLHYLGSDLNAQPGAMAVWANQLVFTNGAWGHVDDMISQAWPVTPSSPVGGRYQPWLRKGQMQSMASLITVTNNYAVKDPFVDGSDYWDFPTNLYPSVGWIGRVHRGTPWQTIYLKDADMIKNFKLNATTVLPGVGTNTWARWVGDALPLGTLDQPQANWPLFYDAANSAPVLDRLLFDIFTTRLNDNAVRGTLPVNQTHLAAWSAVFSGMMALSNSASEVYAGTPLTITNFLIDPAGVQAGVSVVSNLVFGINSTRANTNLFPQQAFIHVGDILATPALTTNLLNLGSRDFGNQQMNYGISDELYEWLPQHMMGLVRGSEPRFVLYCYGQTLHPAPNGMVLSGPFFQLVTNYQVTAESVLRVVMRVDGVNTSHPHAVVESYNVLPPN